MASLQFRKSPTFCPSEYDAIIPGGGGYYVGVFRFWSKDGRPSRDWHARILGTDLVHRLAGFEFSSRTKRELVSYLNRQQNVLRSAIERFSPQKGAGDEPR